MVAPYVDELKRRATKRNYPLFVYDLIRHYDRVEESILLFGPLKMKLAFLCAMIVAP